VLVLFDIDDTLIDHSTAVNAGIAALYGVLSPAVTPPAFLDAWVNAMKAHFPRYLRGEVSYEDQRRSRIRDVVGPSLSDVDADRLFATYFAAYEATWALFPDVIACLDALAAHRLGIISNGQGAEQRSKLHRTGIADRFTSIHISAECGHAKPASEIFHQACETAGSPRGNAAYIGDLYETDAVGARQAGLHGIWLNRGQQEASADRVPPMIRGLGELASMLLPENLG
jgi:putative hydrolase of the HAD superfamily